MKKASNKVRENLRKEIMAIIEDQIKKSGVAMFKKISSGGLFTNPTYDNRTVYSIEDVLKLDEEGFFIKSNVGIVILNAFIE